MKKLNFKILPGLGLLLIIIMLAGCSKTTVTLVGNWIRRSDFEGDTRSSAVVFVINDIAYVGTGYNISEDKYLTDFWKYDPKVDFWQRVADFPGAGRSSAVAFTVNGKGYVGTGYDGTNTLNDFWEYDPINDSWKQVSNYGGTARYSAVAFSIGNYGYVGTGYDGSDEKDFWQYDPSKDTWTQIPSIGGSKRQGSVAFVLNDKAYVLTGVHNGSFLNDMWVLDPSLLGQDVSPWTEKAKLDANTSYTIVRQGASALVLNGEAYIAVGRQSAYTLTTWHYLQSTDTWEQKTSFEGTSREDAISFTANNRAYVALGKNSTLDFDDIWEWAPLQAENTND